jgi:hypothetical protein
MQLSEVQGDTDRVSNLDHVWIGETRSNKNISCAHLSRGQNKGIAYICKNSFLLRFYNKGT